MTKTLPDDAQTKTLRKECCMLKKKWKEGTGTFLEMLRRHPSTVEAFTEKLHIYETALVNANVHITEQSALIARLRRTFHTAKAAVDDAVASSEETV